MWRGYVWFKSVIRNTNIDLQDHKQVFRSEIILSVFVIHLKKVARAAAMYGDQYEALALYTTAINVLLSSLFNHSNSFSFIR